MDFLGFYILQQMKTSHKKQPNLAQQIDETTAALEQHLFRVFIKAVKEHDKVKIKEIAAAVWYFKDKLNTARAKRDPVRHALISIRVLIEMTQSPMKIQVAVCLVESFTGQKIHGKENGYPDFRKLCKELKVPLELSRKTTEEE
jgi:hypothetical protein